MIAVADAGPINYLVLLGAQDILGEVFSEVLIPSEVAAELDHTKTPDAVRSWMVASPEWLKVVQTDPALIAPRPKPAAGLQIADVACIELAERHAGCALLMDDRAAKLEANRRGIVTIGTLSLLFHAGERGMLDFEDALTRLERTTFRASLTLRAHYRQQWENRVRTN